MERVAELALLRTNYIGLPKTGFVKIMQKIYEDPKTQYTWQFPDLGITYFEIPKTGSSSTKTALFRTNFKLAPEDELNIGGGKLAKRFPSARVNQFQPEDFLKRILIIYRDPIARAKSAYRSIFLGRQKLTGSLSEYFELHFSAYLDSAPRDGLLNHHKPMCWFFPSELLEDPRVVFVDTANLSTLPDILDFKIAPILKSQSKMPHLLNVNKSFGNIDMTDSEIQKALGAQFDDDFELFERLSARG